MIAKRTLSLASAAIVLLGLSACSSSQPADEAVGGEATGLDSRIRDPYTTLWEVHVDDALVGYVQSYDFTPDDHQLSRMDHQASGTARPFTDADLRDYNKVERALPAGSHRIQDLEYTDLGFVTPLGEVYRFAGAGAGPESLGVHTLREGLRQFYGEPAKLELVPLRQAVAQEKESGVS